MNKAELIEAVAKKADLSKKDATNAVNATLDTIKANVKKGVLLVGFGAFKTAKRKARMGRNPRTGQPLKIAARTLVKFKAGKGFSV